MYQTKLIQSVKHRRKHQTVDFFVVINVTLFANRFSKVYYLNTTPQLLKLINILPKAC